MSIRAQEHSAITRNCFLDLSGIKGAGPNELNAAVDRGAISDSLRTRMCIALEVSIPILPSSQREIALRNLSS